VIGLSTDVCAIATSFDGELWSSPHRHMLGNGAGSERLPPASDGDLAFQQGVRVDGEPDNMFERAEEKSVI
jgi:hypothetical protein